MATTGTGELRDARDAVIREHMESENRLDFDATLATFDRPRYELVATGRVFGGEDEVRQYYAGSRRAFPDQRNEVHSLRHAEDAVLVEFDLLGRTTRPKQRSHHHAHRAGEVRVVIVFVHGVPETTRLLDPEGATGRVPSSP